MVSKAFFKSINTPTVVCLLSNDDVISSKRSIKASEVECWFRTDLNTKYHLLQ